MFQSGTQVQQRPSPMRVEKIRPRSQIHSGHNCAMASISTEPPRPTWLVPVQMRAGSGLEFQNSVYPPPKQGRSLTFGDVFWPGFLMFFFAG